VYRYPRVCLRHHLLQLLTEVDDGVTLPAQWHKKDATLHFVIRVEHHGGRQHVQIKRQSAYVHPVGKQRLRNLQISIQAALCLCAGGNYMYHRFNIHEFYVLPTQCIYVFCVDLRTNSDYFTVQH